MTNSQRITMLRGLNRAGKRDLSFTECCKTTEAGTPHERLMYAAGFRKGVSQARRGNRSLDRATIRAKRGKPGDKAWAAGFSGGINYVPVNSDAKKLERKKSRKKTQVKYGKRELRRIKKEGF